MQLCSKEETKCCCVTILRAYGIYLYASVIVLHLMTAEKNVTQDRVEKEENSELKGWIC